MRHRKGKRRMKTVTEAAWDYLNHIAAREVSFGVALKNIREDLENGYSDAETIHMIRIALKVCKKDLDEFIAEGEKKDA